jgi:hypothetical protein
MANRNGCDRSTAPYGFPVALSKWLSTNGALLDALLVLWRPGAKAVCREFTRAWPRGQHTAELASRRSRRLG